MRMHALSHQILRALVARQEALRAEVVRVGEVAGVAHNPKRRRPHHPAFRLERLARVRVDDGVFDVAPPNGAAGREDAEDLLDDGVGDGQLVEDVGAGGDGLGGVGAEDAVVFVAELLQPSRVFVQGPQDVADGAAGGVVAGENEDFHLVLQDRHVFFIDGGGCGNVLAEGFLVGYVGVECEVDGVEGLLAGRTVLLALGPALLDDAADGAVHLGFVGHDSILAVWVKLTDRAETGFGAD